MTQLIPFKDCVFIGYKDAEMKQECMRAYPTDEESYYECMDTMIESCEHWQCLDRNTIDREEPADDFLGPYERFQKERYGNILPQDETFFPIPSEDAENRYSFKDDMERMAEAYFESQILDYQGY